MLASLVKFEFLTNFLATSLHFTSSMSLNMGSVLSQVQSENNMVASDTISGPDQNPAIFHIQTYLSPAGFCCWIWGL